MVAADGTGISRSVPCPGDYCEPTDWSGDGTSILLSVHDAGNEDVWALPTKPDGEASPLLSAAYAEKDARYSPDAKWVAYVSEEAERPEVWVRSLTGPVRRMLVSGEGGNQPVWRRDGKVLYFVDLKGKLRSTDVRWGANGEPAFGLPVRPDLPQIGFGHWGTQYDISPDGSRMYFIQPTDEPAPTEIQVAINWSSLLD